MSDPPATQCASSVDNSVAAGPVALVQDTERITPMKIPISSQPVLVQPTDSVGIPEKELSSVVPPLRRCIGAKRPRDILN